MEFALVNVPVPLDVQVILVYCVALDPAVIFVAPDEEQMDKSGPAFAVGGLGLKSMVTLSEDEAQGLFDIVH